MDVVAGDPCWAVVDAGPGRGFWVSEQGGYVSRWWAEVDGKGGVELVGEEGAGATVDEAMDSVAKRPAENGVD